MKSPFKERALLLHGAPGGNRTHNHRIRSPVLYPLSHGGLCSVLLYTKLQQYWFVNYSASSLFGASGSKSIVGASFHTSSRR